MKRGDGEKSAAQDRLVSHAPYQDKAHQQAAAKSKERTAKSKERTASLEMEGNTALVAGALVEIAGFGVMDGLWAIDAATHSMDAASGYRTSLELKLP